MRCFINGQPEDLAEGLTVAELLRERGLGKAACAVEVNESLVPRTDHAERALGAGDRIEIVTLVGGG